MNALSFFPFQELEQAEINIYVIGPNPYQRIATFSKETNFPKEKILTDNKSILYKFLGLKKAKNFFEIKKGKVSDDSKTNKLKGMLWACWKSLRYKNGDIYQFGGFFVFERNGEILFEKKDESIQEHLSSKEILEILKNN